MNPVGPEPLRSVDAMDVGNRIPAPPPNADRPSRAPLTSSTMDPVAARSNNVVPERTGTGSEITPPA